MTPTQLQAKSFSRLAEPFAGEALFDSLTDAVCFIMNSRCEYVLVNQTLAERCGLKDRQELMGRRAVQLPNERGEDYARIAQAVRQTQTPGRRIGAGAF
jgi:hypothetical protein